MVDVASVKGTPYIILRRGITLGQVEFGIQASKSRSNLDGLTATGAQYSYHPIANWKIVVYIAGMALFADSAPVHLHIRMCISWWC